MIKNDLVINALCDDYDIPRKINKTLRFEIGSALKKSLNEGFEKGKLGERTPFFEIKTALQRYSIKGVTDEDLSLLISGALCKAFMSGYSQGKQIFSFTEMSKSSGNEEMGLVAKLINQRAKPEDLSFLNYLSN